MQQHKQWRGMIFCELVGNKQIIGASLTAYIGYLFMNLLGRCRNGCQQHTNQKY